MLLIQSVSALGEQTDYIEDYEDDTLTQQADDSYYGYEYYTSDQVVVQGSTANCYVDNTYAVQ